MSTRDMRCAACGRTNVFDVEKGLPVEPGWSDVCCKLYDKHSVTSSADYYCSLRCERAGEAQRLSLYVPEPLRDRAGR